MRNNYKPALAAVLVSMVLLAGCTELPGKADNKLEQNAAENDVKQDLGAALQQEVGKAAANLEQTVENSTIKLADNIISKGISKELSLSKEVGTSSVLSISNPVGKIEVKPAMGDQITVVATIRFDNDAKHEADRQKIIDDTEVTIDLHGDNINVATHAKDHLDQDLHGLKTHSIILTSVLIIG